MSTNKDIVLLQRDKDSLDEDRKLVVYENDSSMNFIFTNSKDEQITLYDHTYSCITVNYEYKKKSFRYVDVYLTNRFTMDTVKATIDATQTDQADLKECSFLALWDFNKDKHTTVKLALSLNDFDYGDVYIQIYDDPEEKDKYCAPIIVQFTNTPTVYRVDTFKMNPSKSSPEIEDYDNVFSSAFGSELNFVADAGRTDILTSDKQNSEYYNDFMSTDRLITNGLSEDSAKSVHGHPVYFVKYCSFVTDEFSKEFRNQRFSQFSRVFCNFRIPDDKQHRQL